MATWPHLSAQSKTDVLQEGLHTGSEGGRAFHRGVHEAWVAEQAAQPWQKRHV